MCSCSVKRYVSQWTFVCLWGPAFLHSVSRLSNVSDKEAQRNVRAIGLLELWKVPSRDSVPSSRSGWRGSQNTRRLVFLGLPQHHTTKAWVWRHQVTYSSWPPDQLENFLLTSPVPGLSCPGTKICISTLVSGHEAFSTALSWNKKENMKTTRSLCFPYT